MDYIQQKEKQYLERLQNGSYKDFTILYDYYSPKLYAFIFDMIRSRSTTKEIVQETFIKVWEIREQINLDLSFKSFLFTIARNKLFYELRKQINASFTDYIDYANNINISENRVDENLNLDEFMIQLERAKNKLQNRQCEIFKLNKEEGIPIAEISKMLCINEQVVRNQLYRALQVLRKELKDYHFFFIFFFIN